MSVFAGKSKSAKIAIVIVAILVLFILIFGSLFAYYAVKASANNIYNGITVGSADLGGMDKASAIKVLSEKYHQDNLNITIDCRGVVFDVYSSSFSLKIDYDATANEALSYGKDGSIFSKIKNMRALTQKPHNIDLAISCDYDALQYAINENLGGMLEDVQEHSVEFGENELIVSNGKSGRVVPAQKILDAISDAIINDNLSEPIKVSIETKNPEPINSDEFIKKYNRAPKDATVEKNGDEIIIIPEVVGVELDSATAKQILKDNANSTQKYSIPAVISYPQVTAADLEAEYVDTVIATYSTKYSTSSQNRKTNIHLASDKINGYVLNPGEVFSFNGVVGPRSVANGYKLAQAYSGSKVVEDVGGGICQVSSTLYNAVVFADLEIVFRKNHSLPVSYTPLGRDATVSYGSIDFKFKNSYETPIKLEVLHDGSTLTVNIYGRKKYIKDISIETAITGSVPFSVTEIKDDTLPLGETKVEEAGSNGTIVEAYKIVKQDGQIVSRTALSKSTYSPQSKVVRVGTKVPEEAPAEPPVETPPEPTLPQPEADETPAEIPETPSVQPDVPEASAQPEDVPAVEEAPPASNETAPSGNITE